MHPFDVNGRFGYAGDKRRVDTILIKGLFDTSKSFYPLILSYVSQLVGARELAIRGLVEPEPLDLMWQRVLKRGEHFAPSVPIEEQKKDFLTLLGPMGLRSEFQSGPIMFDVQEFAPEFCSSLVRRQGLGDHLIRASGSLLVLAHEFSRDKPWHDKGPLLEFLRHCRNAWSHGGRFNLLHGEPVRPAIWGPFQIEPGHRGTLLFKTTSENGLLSIGDPILLLSDIEKAYPQMA